MCGGGGACWHQIFVFEQDIIISVELVSDPGSGGSILVRRGRGWGACWHLGFVFEQDILISVELVSTQEAAAPS